MPNRGRIWISNSAPVNHHVLFEASGMADAPRRSIAAVLPCCSVPSAGSSAHGGDTAERLVATMKAFVKNLNGLGLCVGVSLHDCKNHHPRRPKPNDLEFVSESNHRPLHCYIEQEAVLIVIHIEVAVTQNKCIVFMDVLTDC